MHDQTCKKITKFMDAAMPAGFAGAFAFEGVKEAPSILFNLTRSAYHSLLIQYHQDESLISKALVDFDYTIIDSAKTETWQALSNNSNILASAWAIGVFLYLFRAIYYLDKTHPHLKPRIEPQLPWPDNRSSIKPDLSV